jgi:hypothetical protein
MSTLAYLWAPRSYASPTNPLPLPLLHKVSVLIWLLIFCHRWTYQQLALSANEAWEKPPASTNGDLTNFQIPAEPSLMTPPFSMKQLDRSVPIIPTKGWNVRSLAFLGQAEVPEANTKTRPPDLWPLLSPFLIVSQLAKHLGNFQLLN